MRRAMSVFVLIGMVGASVAGTASVASADPAVLAKPVITGSPSLGGTLTADIGDYAGEVDYEWRNLSEGVLIADVLSTYIPDSGDKGDLISVGVRPKGATATPYLATEKPVSIGAGSISPVQNSVLPGASFTLAGALFAPNTVYSVDSSAFSATVTTDALGKFTLLIPVATTEKAGSLRITIKHAIVQAVATATITVTQPPKPPVIKGSSPTISGTVKVNNTVRAAVGSWSSNASFDYQWLRDGKSIPGEINSTYSLLPSDVSRSIRVRVVGSTDDASLTATSPSYKVAAATFSSTAALKLKGKAKVKRTLKAVASGSYRPSAESVTYQWYLNGKAVGGATKTTIKVKKSWKGKYLSVKMTTKRTGYLTSTRTAYSAKIKK